MCKRPTRSSSGVYSATLKNDGHKSSTVAAKMKKKHK